MWTKLRTWLGITQRETMRLFLAFFLWRAGLFVASIPARNNLPYRPSFPYATTLLPQFGLPQWLYSWANFDGVHYLTIAREGYTHVRFVQAFFPLLPALILRPFALLASGSANVLAIGLIVSNFAALCAFIFWFAFVKTHTNPRTAWIATLLLLLFPTSLFFGALYTESLFFLFVIGCFLAAHKKQWLLASLFACLGSATRIVGIFLVPALLIELLATKPFSLSPVTFYLKNWRIVALILLGSLGLIGYMVYLQFVVGDPLAFFHSQAAFGAGRQTSLVLYPQVVFRAVKILLTSPFDLKYLAYTQEFLAGTFGLVGLLLGTKYARPSWSVFALCAFFLPTLTGTFSSMGRYLLVCFPLFLFGAHFVQRHRNIAFVWYVASCILLIINTILFIQGYWVA